MASHEPIEKNTSTRIVLVLVEQPVVEQLLQRAQRILHGEISDCISTRLYTTLCKPRIAAKNAIKSTVDGQERQLRALCAQ